MPTTFNDLPREIRIQIFQLVSAAEGGRRSSRIVEVFSRNGQIYARRPPPALLHVCSESRYVTLKRYKPWLPQFKGTPVYTPWAAIVERLGEGPSRLQNVYLDIEDDILLLTGSEFPYPLGPLDEEYLDSVAFETDWFSVSGFPCDAFIPADDVLTSLPYVEQLRRFRRISNLYVYESQEALIPWSRECHSDLWRGIVPDEMRTLTWPEGELLHICYCSKNDLPIHPPSSMPWTSYKFSPLTAIRSGDADNNSLDGASPSPQQGQVHLRGGAGFNSSAHSSPRSSSGSESVYHTPTQDLVQVQFDVELAASTPTPASRAANVPYGNRNQIDDEVTAPPIDVVENPSSSTPPNAPYGLLFKQTTTKKRAREEQDLDVDIYSFSTPRKAPTSRSAKQTYGKKRGRVERHTDEDTILDTAPIIVITDNESSTTQYVVEKFRADRRTPAGLEILVEWEDYPAESDWTWETETSLTESVPDLVEAWHSREPKTPRKGSVILGEEEEEEEVLEVLEVEKIMDRRKHGGVLHYLVKWRGYEAEKDRTWEPCEKLRVDVPLLVEEYEKKKESKRTRRKRGNWT